MKINIISHNNGVGLSQDIDLIMSILGEHTFNFLDTKQLTRRPRADVNVFLELVEPKCFKLAKVNIFIPNPEWFWDVRYLRHFDLILVKTRDAERIFNNFGCPNVIYTSFTSKDKYMKDVSRERVYLHMAGKSSMKGTKTVYTTWMRNKDYPLLILGKIEKNSEYYATDNVGTIFYRIPDDKMQILQNRCVFHVCTSEYEGFGHYIHEAKSCGAIIITTDAPPMNEFIKREYGYLASYSSTKRFNHGKLHKVSNHGLQRSVDATIELTDKEIKSMSEKSRQSFLDNDKFFRDKLIEVFKNL